MSRSGHTLPKRESPTLILGLGNTILSDDGVGIYVSREIEKLYSGAGVDFIEASLGGLELLDLMRGYRKVVIVDALGTAGPGSLVRLKAEDLTGGSAMSRHQVPLNEALALGQRLKMDLPEEIVIYGIGVKDVTTFGDSCTPEVTAAIPAVARRIIREEIVSSREQGKKSPIKESSRSEDGKT